MGDEAVGASNKVKPGHLAPINNCSGAAKSLMRLYLVKKNIRRSKNAPHQIINHQRLFGGIPITYARVLPAGITRAYLAPETAAA